MSSENSFDARAELEVGGRTYEIHRLEALQSAYDVARLPFSLKVLLENLLRNEDGVGVRREDIEALATWDAKADPSKEIAFTPARVILQDFTGVPCVVDLAALRDAMADMGGDPSAINPLVPVELVIDHSVQVDAFGSAQAFRINAEKEFERNGSATRSCAGARPRSRASRPCRPTRASSTRSTSSTSPASCSRTRARCTPTRSSGPTRTRR